MGTRMLRFGACALAAAVMTASPALAATKTTKAKKGVVKGKTVSTVPPGFAGEVIKLMGTFPSVKGTTTRGVTRDAINIGVIADITQGGNVQYYGGCEGVKARVDRANAAKELKRKINIVGCENADGDPTKTDALVKEMVESKKAFGLIYVGATLASDKYLTDNKVPYVGWGIIPAFCGWDKPYGFGTSGSLTCDAIGKKTNGTKAAVSTLTMSPYIAGSKKNAADLKVAVISEDNPAGRLGNVVQKQSIEKAGAKVVYLEAKLPTTQAADYAPYIQDILKAQPNMVMLSTAFVHVAPLAAGLRAAGYQGDIEQFVFFDSGILQVPQLAAAVDTTYAMTPGLGSPSFPNASWDRAAADTKAAGLEGKFFCDKLPTGIGGCGLGFTQHYISADFWIQALKAFEKTGKALTSEELVNTINSGWTYEGIPSMACPSSWPIGHVTGSPCGSLVQWDVANKQLKGLVDLKSYEISLDTIG